MAIKQQTFNNVALLSARLGLGLIVGYYGSASFGLFGGRGFEGMVSQIHQSFGVPTLLATLAVLAEALGSLGVVFGLMTRLAAFAIASTMAVAFYFRITAPQAAMDLANRNERAVAEIALPLALCALAIVILCLGAGEWSLDQRFFKGVRRRSK